MAPKSTVFKAELQVTDMDRHYYAQHNLTLAQHPSETEQRLMARLITFALLAQERLEFARGLSEESEPDLWRRDYTGDIEQWVELGNPDESRIRKACGRCQQVVVVNYAGNIADMWWAKNSETLSRSKNLSVINIKSEMIDDAVRLLQRSMRLTAMIQDGEMQLMSENDNVLLRAEFRKRADGFTNNA